MQETAMDKLTAVAANSLANAAMIAALIRTLNRVQVLGDAEVHELYEFALQLIEEGQAASQASQEVFEIARELIEQHLRGRPKP
jgi:hypothetical protein